MTSKNVLFFPHERATLAAVHDLNVRSKSRRRLQALLTEASTVVQRHTATLDGPERARIGPFEDLVELAERHAAQTKGRIVADLVLLTTVQIGQLLVLAEEQPSLLSTRVYPLAFGAGLLAAGVAVAASTVDDIVTLGLEAVSVSFRLGLALQRRGKDIEDSDEPWARVVSNAVSGSDLEQALERFNASLSPMNRVYIGQLLAESTVIFGPPSTLDAFTKTPEIAPAMALPMKVLDKAPMHGSHLPVINATSIVGAGSVTGKVTELWKRAVDQVAHQRIYMEETVAALVNDLESNTDIILTSIGSSETSGITTLLEKNSILVETSQLSPTPKPYGDDINSIPADAIAVVGMSGRFPDSDTLDEFWKLLETAQTTHQVIPETRFNIDDFYDPTRAKHNALLARYGCFLKNPGDFDHRLFNISPREAMQMDPVQRMLLMTTYEALEMAGYSSSPESEHEQTLPRIATYFGQTVDDWKSINEQQGIDTHFLPGVNRGFAPGRLSHFFQWAGGFYSIDTGCSSSATALCLARDALAAGKYDAAVVGGGTLLTAPEWFAGLSQGGFLSPTGACKTFSDTADGYCRGEGVGVVVLKRLADALRDKDDVVAVIAGASRNCNAGAGSITYPGEKAQGELYRRVMRQAAVRPEQVDVVEMHGTGTQAGDRVEMHAVQGVFAPSNGPQREKPLIVGALKANIGHSEAAAGIISMMKAILVLQHDKIPAQPSQPIKLNPHLAPLIGSQIQLANGQSWTRNGSEPRYIFVNNFDAAGGNVSMLLQDPPAFALLAPPQSDARTHHVIVTSGRTATAHEANRKRLLQYLNEHPDTNLADLAYTTTARRMHNVHRDAYVVSSTSDLLRQLQKPLNDKLDSAPPSAVVFAFTGQGAQSLGMGGALYSTSPAFRSLVDSLQDLCDAQGLPTKFINAIRNPQDEGSVTEVDMQVATVALEIALARYWQSLRIRPTALIGHSLGEYAALCIAGVLSASDTLALAFKRASLIFSRCPSSEAGMLAVNLPMRTVQYRIRDSAATAGCEVCCVNGPSSTVVGGPVAAIDALGEYLKSEDGGKVSTTRLRVQHAFHTRQMDVLLDELEAAAAQVPFRAPTLPVASTVLGRIVKQGEKDVFNAEYLRRHTREPVAFLDAVRACEAGGLISERAFAVEIGPHPICIGLIAACLESARVNAWPSLRRGGEDWQAVSGVMAAAHRAQLPVSWQEFHKDHLGSVRLINDLPTYAFDLKTFWHSYKSPVPASTVPSASTTAGRSRLSSTTLHSVEEMKKKDGTLFGKFTVDLSDPKLAKAIGGHVVDESAICPASIFIDMAYTAAAYLEQEQQYTSPSLTAYELTSLEMHSPLVLRDDMEVLPQVWVEAALDTKINMVSVHFKGLKSPKTTPVEYGSAVMHLAQNDSSARREWSRIQPLVKARVQTLNNAIRPREVHALDTALFYKVFSEIVDYSPPYHAVQEAVIASDFRDAAVTLQLTPTADHGRFISSPLAVDALVHVAGFLLNADVRRAKHEVHIANHIGSLRIVGDISSPGTYHVYATIREQDSKTGTSLCDVYATDGHENLVAVCTDICFKKLDRDFFALLTGATRGRSPRPVRAPADPVRAIPTPKRAKQVAPSPSPSPSSSSGSSGTNTPVSRPDTPGSVSDTVDLSDELLEAVAERTGVSVDEMKGAPGTTFTEFGVDSQMAIAILANFQRTTAVELPAAFFTNFPTPADVQQELGSSIADFEEMEMAKPSPKPKVSDSVTVKKSQGPALSGHLLSLVADALGLEDSDLTPSTTFDSVGMDSMLSIKITAAFQSETSVELPAAFFTQNPTVGSAQEALDDEDDTENTPTPAAAAAAAAAAPAKEPTKSDPRQQKLSSAVSRAVLIQGKSQSRSAPLFLTTDGSGTVESYIHLKALPAGRRIYALESPFLEHPETFDLSIEEMASIFLRTIRRIQPTGPYLIGGWSAGSMYAYEVAHRLTREGESIDALIILDMRAPSLIPTSIVTTEFVNKLGTFEGINRARDLPEDLSVKEREHLMATCRALSAYDAPAFAAGREPKHVAVVWAREGLDNRPDAPVAAMERPGVDIGKTLYEMNLDEFERYFNSWFYGRRETFGMNGWETLVGEGISVHTVNGDHFSMMCPPFAEEVGAVVVETVRRAVE